MDTNEYLMTGNAGSESQLNSRRGWFIGEFMPSESGLKKTDDVEVKWGIHPKNDERIIEGINPEATSLSILINGLFVLDFPHLKQTIQLQKTGDYALWSPGVSHTWKALEDSVILTVRWPSIFRKT